MRKRLQIAFMLTATTAIATSFPPTMSRAWAVEGDSTKQGITTTEEHGRKIYVNEDEPKARPVAPQPKRAGLVYWSSKENRR
jgi:hypothetical protein